MIRTERRGRIAVVRLDDPPLNLLGRKMIDALKDAFDELASDPPDVAVLHCRGGGANVRELAELQPETARDFIGALHAACQALRTLDAPVIAAVDGPCLGAHLEVAAACDLRLCTPSSRFGMPEVRIGIPSVIDAWWLIGVCGLGEASRLVYEGTLIDAAEAYRIRLVNRVADDIETGSSGWANEIASAPAGAMAHQKRVLRDWTHEAYERAAVASIEHLARSFAEPHAREAMQAFLNRPRG